MHSGAILLSLKITLEQVQISRVFDALHLGPVDVIEGSICKSRGKYWIAVVRAPQP